MLVSCGSSEDLKKQDVRTVLPSEMEDADLIYFGNGIWYFKLEGTAFIRRLALFGNRHEIVAVTPYLYGQQSQDGYIVIVKK